MARIVKALPMPKLYLDAQMPAHVCAQKPRFVQAQQQIPDEASMQCFVWTVFGFGCVFLLAIKYI